MGSLQETYNDPGRIRMIHAMLLNTLAVEWLG